MEDNVVAEVKAACHRFACVFACSVRDVLTCSRCGVGLSEGEGEGREDTSKAFICFHRVFRSVPPFVLKSHPHSLLLGGGD
jgi:hypothetical protein